MLHAGSSHAWKVSRLGNPSMACTNRSRVKEGCDLALVGFWSIPERDVERLWGGLSFRAVTELF